MDKNLMTVLVVLIICITFVALAIIGFTVDFIYEGPDGTKVKAVSKDTDTTTEDKFETQVLADDRIEE